MNRKPGFLLACCCACGSVHATSLPGANIANGIASSEWPGVGALIVRVGGGYGQCTATLISPTWVLTAAHCLQDSSNPQDYSFVPQADYSCCTASGGLAVASIAANPQYDTLAHDQGLVQLAAPLAGITPLIVNDQAPPGVGSYLHLLGYGITQAGGNTLKQLGLVRVSSFDATTLSFDSGPTYAQACQGDAGAPSFNYAPNGFPLVHATFSYGSSPTCSMSTFEVSSRTDSDIAWIRAHASDACVRSAPSGSGCDGIFRNGIDSLAIAPAAPVVTLWPVGESPSGR